LRPGELWLCQNCCPHQFEKDEAESLALSASGHASDEWKRYLNMTPDKLQHLLEPVEGQGAQEVGAYAEEVMRGLRPALKYDQVEPLFSMPA
jgi:hypothetical protein